MVIINVINWKKKALDVRKLIIESHTKRVVKTQISTFLQIGPFKLDKMLKTFLD